MTRVRKGMEVRTTDGQSLGKVAEVWLGTDPTASSPLCDDALCSRVEVQSGGFFKRSTLYVPYSAIAEVAVDQVILNIDAATAQARPWKTKPSWGTQ
jgi:sporulation protein YlmC with PRC-barrel domain